MARAAFPDFGKRLRAVLDQRTITNKSAFAREHEFSQGQISRWTLGGMPDTQEALQRLAAALDVPWEYLLVGEEGATVIAAYLAKTKTDEVSARVAPPQKKAQAGRRANQRPKRAKG